MRHVLGPSWACVECLTDEELPDEGVEGYIDTTRLTVWNGYMVCLYHLPGFAKKVEKSMRPKKRSRPQGDIIDGQCQAKQTTNAEERRCMSAEHHSDDHNWGPWTGR